MEKLRQAKAAAAALRLQNIRAAEAKQKLEALVTLAKLKATIYEPKHNS